MNVGRTLACLVFVLCICTGHFVFANSQNINPQGSYVSLGDYRLYFHCQGEGNKTVLIDAGIGDSSANWLGIATELSQDTRTCIFDRAGYGMSDPGPSPRSTASIVTELYTVLQKAKIPGPYIMVGHSFGGFTAQYFARVLPEQIAGVVLVESSHPEQVERLKELDTMADAKPKKLVGIPNVRDHMTTEQVYWDMLNSQRKAIYAQMEELRAFEQSTKELRDLSSFPEVPLIVLSRGRSQLPSIEGKYSLEAVWQQMQIELAALSSESQHIIVNDSGHSIHLEAPEVIIESVRQMLDQGES